MEETWRRMLPERPAENAANKLKLSVSADKVNGKGCFGRYAIYKIEVRGGNGKLVKTTSCRFSDVAKLVMALNKAGATVSVPLPAKTVTRR